MASVPASREAVGSRSGGKIVRTRRPRSRKTPYQRPGRSNLGTVENPSWISRFIFSPTLTIAGGAGKLLSSVFVSESSSSSSSSDSDSEDDVEDDAGGENCSNQGTEEVKKNGASEMVNLFRGDCPPVKKESKRLIEQLLMQETFSRAERDKLFQIIESRVVECETIGGAEVRLTEISNRTVDTDNGGPAVCSTAIVEAKKWLNETRLGSSSKLEVDHGPCTLNSMMLPMDTDEEMGSPVDVAKSYMRARPPWASPSVNNFEFKSPSPLGFQLFKEETSYSINGNPLSSSKMKRESPASGSWNIQEEIRRVRSKATEEMLRTLPSSKLDWSSYASDYKSKLNSIRADTLKIYGEDKRQYAAKAIDKSLNFSADNIVTHNLSESKITQGVSENGSCLLNTTSDFLLQDKDLETNPTTERKVANSSLDDRECSTVNEVVGLANGFPPPSSLSGEPAVEQNCVNLSEELAVEQNHVNKISEEKNSSGHDHEANKISEEKNSSGCNHEANKISEEKNSSGHDHETTQGIPVAEPCALLNEASMEVTNINENDTGKVLSEENINGKVQSEEKATCNVNTVEQLKPSSQSSVSGKTSTLILRRGRRRN